jgi:hypothetical protein
MPNGRPPSFPPRIQVNRRFGRYKIPHRPYPRSRPTHLPSSAVVRRHPLDQLSHRTRGPFWAPRPKTGSHDGVISGLRRKQREVGSKCHPPPRLC